MKKKEPKQQDISKPSFFDDLFGKTLPDAVEELKVRLLNKALKDTKFNQKAAAKKLGITYHQFRGLYRKFQQSVR